MKTKNFLPSLCSGSIPYFVRIIGTLATVYGTTVLFGLAQESSNQEEPAVFRPQPVQIFRLCFDGKIKVSTMPVGMPIEPFGLQYLSNSKFRDELALSDDQDRSIKQFVKETREHSQTIIESTSGSTSVDSEKLAKAKGFLRSSLERLMELLLPHQQVRSKEVMLRFELRRHGIVQQLLGGEFSRVMGLSSREKNSVFRKGTQLATKFSDIVVQEKETALDDILSVLKPGDRKTVEEFMKTHQPIQNCNFGMFLYHLDLAGAEPETDEEVHEYEGLRCEPVFLLDVDGSFVPRITKKLSKATLDNIVYNTLPALLIDQDASRTLVLTELQRENLLAVNEYCQTKSNELDRDIQSRLENTKADSFDPVAIRSYLDQQNSILCSEIRRDIESILLPHQLDELEVIVGRIEFYRKGILHMLLVGEIGKTLGLSSEEKDKLRDRGNQVRKKLAKKSIEIEDDIYRELFDVLNDEQTKKINELLGEPLRKSHANLDLLLLQLRF